jgi:hypothetical protein
VQKQDKGWDEGITRLCRKQEVAPGCCCTRRPGGVPAEGTGVRVRVKGTHASGEAGMRRHIAIDTVQAEPRGNT